VSSGRDFIGPFQLVRLIRSGQTTQVWEVIREGQEERFALKVLHKEYADDKDEIEQLKHEVMVAKNLAHPNVIKILGFHAEYGRPLIAMELFNGRNLKLVLRDSPELIEQNVATVIRDCAKGLQHLHEKGWVHCDVKPDNFLMDDRANVKLIDFSIALKQAKGFSLFQKKPKTIQGTRSYMAPEQIRRRPPDSRADIYSFGCVLFELVARRPPFSAPSPDELLSKHLRATPPFLQSVNNRATAEFSNLVQKMMAKDPAKRPASIKDFLVEFAKCSVFKAGVLRKPGNS
jgi:eukaryotic-like serine/threonine-protein kinase